MTAFRRLRKYVENVLFLVLYNEQCSKLEIKEGELMEVVYNEIELLTSIDASLSNISGFLIFFIVVILCYFVYKFFNMFF